MSSWSHSTQAPTFAHIPTSMSSLQRYLPYSWQLEHYSLNDTLQAKYSLSLPMAQRISNLQHLAHDPLNQERRNARHIAQIIYQQPVPPKQHMVYLSKKDERMVEKEMTLLDDLTQFKPQYVVLVQNQGIPVQCLNDNPNYWKLSDILARRYKAASTLSKSQGPAVPQWPQLQDSFDCKQFIVAAVLYRDEVTRFLTYYLVEDLKQAQAAQQTQAICFAGSNLSKVPAEERKPKVPTSPIALSPVLSPSGSPPLPAPVAIASIKTQDLLAPASPDVATSAHIPEDFPLSPPQPVHRQLTEVEDHTLVQQSVEDQPVPDITAAPYMLSLPPSRDSTPGHSSAIPSSSSSPKTLPVPEAFLYSSPSHTPSTNTSDQEGVTVFSQVIRAQLDQENFRRAEARRRQRELEQSRRIQERQELEEARLARQSSRAEEPPITQDISQAIHVNPTRGRYSHNPVMDSMMDPPSMHPAYESTPYAPRAETGRNKSFNAPRASLAVPDHIHRMGNTGLAELVGGAPPSPPRPPQHYSTAATSPPQGHSSSRLPRDSPSHRSYDRPTTSGGGGGRFGGIGGGGGPPSDSNGTDQDDEEEDEDPLPRRRRRRHHDEPPYRPNHNQDQHRGPQNWQGPLPFHVEQKLKISDLPEFDGSDHNLITWLTKVNNLAEQNNFIATQLGTLLPYRFKERASNWWFSIPRETRAASSIDWYTLRAAMAAHFMNPTWMAEQRSIANKIRFRSKGHSQEEPIEYVLRKKRHLTLIQTLSFDLLIHEIMIGAPSGWQTILRIDDLQGEWTEFINRVHTHSHALIEAKSSSSIQQRMEQLEESLRQAEEEPEDQGEEEDTSTPSSAESDTSLDNPVPNQPATPATH
ncbi:hypothetical protein RhiJN_25217 [Ceratobasidium sp. AG-Ba]|nr:hypothetical protein RhiJN_25217 [Ceratobasidium sp. AG-Ba]